MNPSFEKHKLIRFIKREGRPYTFQLKGANEFGEPTVTVKEVTISGVYHEVMGYASLIGETATSIKTKPQSWIMCLVDEAKELEEGMAVTINGKDYVLVDRRDVNNFEVASDLSLEVVLKNGQ